MNMIKNLRALTFGGALILTSSLGPNALNATTTDPIGVVSDAAIHLLTAPLTITQRQMLHAANFNEFPPSLRPLYIHAVALGVGAELRGNGDFLVAHLAEYLQSASILLNSQFHLPKGEAFETHFALVREAMRELNFLIAPQVASDPLFQRAIALGAVVSFEMPGGSPSL